jgi:hypothetical protein
MYGEASMVLRDSAWWHIYWEQVLSGGDTMINVRLFDQAINDLINDLAAAEKRAGERP